LHSLFFYGLKYIGASFWELLADRNQQALLAVTCAWNVAWCACLTTLPLFAAASWGATAADLGQMYSIQAFAGLVGASTGGHLADTVGRTAAVLIGAAATGLPFVVMQLLVNRRPPFPVL
jgi:nitrate/nitrite transporter NarK